MQFFSTFLTVCLASVVAGHHGDGKPDFKQVNREVTIKMLQTLTEDDNTVMSPLLLTNSMLVLANAASGESRDEILKALNLNSEEDLEHVNADAKHLFDIREHLLEMKGKAPITDKTEFDLLPKLIVKTPKSLKESFTKMVKENYPMDVYKMAEWSEDAQKTETKALNEWFITNSKTGLINRLIDDNDLTSDVQMLLLGGAVFKGAWKGQLFDKAATTEDEFKNADGKVSKVDFMNKENAAIRVDRDDTDKVLGLAVPFTQHEDGHGHKHGTKLVLLQSTADDVSIDKILEDLTQEKLTMKLKKIMEAPIKNVAKFSMPKMNLEKEYELKDSLAELGVKGLFDSTMANFSRMIEGADVSKNGELTLTQLEHRAIVQWTEESDDSALNAATGDDEPAISMNKPFAFFILDDPSTDVKKTKRHAGHDHSHDHSHDESNHNDAMIIFAGRVKTFSKDLTFGKNE